MLTSRTSSTGKPVVAMDDLGLVQAQRGDWYRIRCELGRGRMSLVCLAEDVKLRRTVAIKVSRTEIAASLGLDRFLREIEVTARRCTRSLS